MRTSQIKLLSVLALGASSALCVVPIGCTADVHDNQADVDIDVNIENATVSVNTETDLDNVKPDDSISMNVESKNVILVDPSSTPTSEQVKAAGHFQFYMDDYNSAPVLVTAQTSVSIKIAATLKEGGHKVLCRVHKHDGTATKATFELSFTLKVSTTTGTDSGVLSDSGVADSGVSDSGAADGAI